MKLYANLETVVARSDEVERDLGDRAFRVLQTARAKLAPHTKTGETRVTQTKGFVDHYINLESTTPEVSMSIEEGHINKKTGEFVEGLHILRDSLKAASG